MDGQRSQWWPRGKGEQPETPHDAMFESLKRWIQRDRARLRRALSDPDALAIEPLAEAGLDDALNGAESGREPAPPPPSRRRSSGRLYEVFLEGMGGEPPDN